MPRRARPRSAKTPGRQARDLARAQRDRAIQGGQKKIRDQVHVSLRAKAWSKPGDRLRQLRLTDPRRELEFGNAGRGQRRTTGPRQDMTVKRRPPKARKSPLMTKKRKEIKGKGT